jgi:glyoxylase-like metal-dependent hydrolase (beta-lactamase superfamily II)
MGLEQSWFRVWEDRPGIWVIEEPLHSEVVKSYLVIGNDRAALIDTGMGVGDLNALVRSITDLPIVVLQSHAHNDHIGSAWQFDAVCVHPAEAEALAKGMSADRLANWFSPHEMSGPLPASFNPVGYSIPGTSATALINDGDTIDLGGFMLEVIHAPGHSAGGLVFLDRANRNLYSADVVYLRELYLMNPDSSVPVYAGTLERLIDLIPLVDRLYPSHGPTPISPEFITPMASAMRKVQRGHHPDRVDDIPGLDGGRDDTAGRAWIEYHEFGDFEILLSSWATRN